MLRRPIGVVKFRDVRLNTRARISISKIPWDNTTHLFLDLDDPEGPGVLGAGDLEIGLDKENTKQLLAVVQKAIATSLTRSHSWETVGEAGFSWSDHARQSESGEDYGTILIEMNGLDTRMVFRTKKWDWEPYVATFSSTILDELSALLSRALLEP
jgi:hypothetical protein